jgi:ubiquinone/menaquinone biosynthesis C-methylase UbiE
MLGTLRRLKSGLNDRQLRRLRLVAGPFARGVETLVFGGRLRRSALKALWLSHMRSAIRRDLLWAHPDRDLHFSTTTETFNLFANAAETISVRNFTRAFLAAEVIQPGDAVLDIGCGEGFFSKRFYGHDASHVDAIDIERSAITRARRSNPDPKIAYLEGDAVTMALPRSVYDVVIWDGAIGHFSPAVTDLMLEKIARHLRPDGVFAGSESLGDVGGDHLQFWSTPDDLARLFKKYFRHVELRVSSYAIGDEARHLRTEAYWRCSNGGERLQQLRWQPY